MILYDGGMAPNPRRVRIFLAEKGIDVPLKSIDMTALGHKGEEITRLNPLQRLPVLVLDDGTVISESIAICRYFEELHPQPALMGTTPIERAIIEMWQRRMEFNLLSGVANVFRHTHPAMKEWEVPQIAEFAEANRPRVISTLRWLNDELDTREFIAGDEYSVADITAMISIDFMKPARLTVPDDLSVLLKWYERVKSRPSATA